MAWAHNLKAITAMARHHVMAAPAYVPWRPGLGLERTFTCLRQVLPSDDEAHEDGAADRLPLHPRRANRRPAQPVARRRVNADQQLHATARYIVSAAQPGAVAGTS